MRASAMGDDVRYGDFTKKKQGPKGGFENCFSLCTYIYIYILVGGFNHLEKYEFVNRTDCPIYYGK